MASKRRASTSLEGPPKIPRLSHTYDNTGTGFQHNNTGSGKQFNAQAIYIDEYQATRKHEDFDYLKDLRVTDPRDEKARIEDTKGGLLVESYEWILYNEDLIRWRDEERSGLFWINGGPGKGKTMLLCGIIDELFKSSAEDSRPSFFFCQHDDSRLNDATEVLRGLIYLLAIQRRSAMEAVQERYRAAGGKLLDHHDTFFALSNILKSILAISSTSPIYLVVDALDECQKDLRKLLDLIRHTSLMSPTCVKWIVTSRNRYDIDEALEFAQKETLSLDQMEASVYAAVNIYIKHKVSQLARMKKYASDLKDAVGQYLRDNAQGTFLWVALVCESLGEIKPWKTRSELHSFPAGLQSLYRQMMDQMFSSDDTDVDICTRILAVAMIACRPLSLTELPSLVGLPEDIASNAEWLSDIIRLCGSFLIVRHGVIYFVHQSAKAYLSTNASAKLFTPSLSLVHYSVYSRSLRILMETLRRDMYDIEHPGLSIQQVKKRDPDPLAAAHYSCIHWVDHLAAIDRDGLEYINLLSDDGDLYSFLRGFLLYWLEALALTRSISRAVVAFATLETLLEELRKEEESKLLNLIKDARRFILRNRGLIENAPLQTYVTALIFSPANSLIRSLARSEEPAWIEANPTVEEDWSACLQMLQGHRDSVTSVAFSFDNKYLASASMDYSVRIWDVVTGKNLQTLEGHADAVHSVAFSRKNNQCIASASSDRTIKTWNAVTGKCKQTLQGHRNGVRSIAFSDDSEYLVSASADRTVKIWKPATGICLKTLEGHSNWVNDACFSYNNRQLISGSSDSTVKVWNVTLGRYDRTLKGHSDWVNSLSCSREGRFFVSASSDQTIKVWEEAGQCLRTLEGHTQWINSVTLSYDDKYLASASSDRTVKIWDIATGKCTRTFQGHTDSINAVKFSCDNKFLASAWADRTVRIWEIASDEYAEEPDSHTNWVNAVVFSPDRKYLASMSDDQTVKIWNTATRKCVHTLEGHSDSVNSIIFSHNNTYLASASSDRTVKIFHLLAKHLRTLEGHSHLVSSIAFSHNDHYLASVGDSVVKVWDVISGQCIRTLEGHSDYVTSVTFSNNDQHLASSSNDKTCRVWDLLTNNCQRILKGHSDCVSSVLFSTNDELLVSTSGDETVKIWELASGECAKTLEGHSDWVSSAALSHDGRYVASTSSDRTVRFWDTGAGECVRCIDVGVEARDISFDETDAYLLTDRGCIVLNPSTGHGCVRGQSWYGYGLSSDRSWITFHGQNVLWLPLEYRVVCSAVCGAFVSIGCSSGKVLILRFSEDISPTLNGHAERIAELCHDGIEESWQPTTPQSCSPVVSQHTTTIPIRDASSQSNPEAMLVDEREEACTEVDSDYRTLLHLAVLRGDEEAVQRILGGRKINQNAKDKDSRTALYYAIQSEHRAISLLLARKWNVPEEVVISHLEKPTYEYKAQALYSAIKRCNKDEVGFLIEIGADMGARGYGDWAGWKGTALHEAAWYGTPDLLQLMLDNGANKRARDIGGRTPSQRPNWSRTAEISRLLS
ncbi:WD40-repeat-containing domain protein [Xylariaceae sp. FL0662B]|nr:WD40-repeat-containing domain protein [Xylariaceae sp. FL0662B]